MRNMHNRIIIVMALLGLSAMACNAPGFGRQPTQGGVVEPEIPTESTVTLELAETETGAAEPIEPAPALPSGMDTCPEATEGTNLYINEPAGYCFLYPERYTESGNEAEPLNVYFADLGEIPEGAMEFIVPSFTVAVSGPVGGSLDYSAESYAAYQNSLFAFEGTYNEPFPMGELAGRRYGPVPGMGPRTSAVVIANNTIYTLTVAPDDRSGEGEFADAVEEIWSVVGSSITFFTPASTVDYVLPGEVCPVAAAGEVQIVNYAEGYCFTMPDTFREQEDFSGMFIGGEPLAGFPGVYSHPSVTIGYNGRGSQPVSYDEMRNARLDAASNPANLSFEMGTVAGNEALIVTSYDGPVPDRVAMVYADTGVLYSILAQPIDYARYPGADPYVEQLWDAITGSIQFFEPYD